MSDGDGTVTWKQVQDTVMGRLDLVNQSIIVALTAGDTHTPASFTDVTSNFNEAFVTGGATFDGTSHFVIPADGIYRITAWVSLSSDSAGSPIVAMDINVNGVAAAPGSAVVQTAQKNANDIVTVSGFGVGSFVTGDVIGLSFASTGNTNITLRDSVFDLQRIRA